MMGVGYYLCNAEKRVVLACSKAYWLAEVVVADPHESVVTPQSLAEWTPPADADHRKGWGYPAVVAFVGEHGPCQVLTDLRDDFPWEEYTHADGFTQRPGWHVYEIGWDDHDRPIVVPAVDP